MLHSSILLRLQLARSAPTPQLWGAKFLPWQPWAPRSDPLMPLTPGLHRPPLLPLSCVAQATSSLCGTELFGDRVLQTPPGPVVPPGTILAWVGGEGAKRGGCSSLPASLLGTHMPVTDGCLPPTLQLRQALASLWRGGPRGRDPPVHGSKASSSAGHGTARASVVWSQSGGQRCS